MTFENDPLHLLRQQPPVEPPAGLLEELRRQIPAEIQPPALRPGNRNVAPFRGPLPPRGWLAAASVIVAASAREAASLLDGADVVVTDYAMPGETGLWLLERVRERRYPIPVIVVTGYADLYAKELRTAPFARVLGKPIDPWQLCETVAAVLRGG